MNSDIYDGAMVAMMRERNKRVLRMMAQHRLNDSDGGGEGDDKGSERG